MSEAEQQLAETLTVRQAVKEGVLAIAPGLQDFFAETGAELKRLGTQGSMELANLLFNGNAFVPYGPGQYTPDQEHGAQQEQTHEQGMER